MTKPNPTVLIGPLSDDPAESVSAVNRAFISGLGGAYRFIPSRTNRRFGNTEQARFNAWNLYYLAKHAAIWVWHLLRRRPAIAHYAINGGSALWKSLLFLRLARCLGARTVGQLHSGGFLDFWQSLPDEKRSRALSQFAKLDAFVVLSDRWKKAMEEEVGVPARLLHVVNNPIDAHFEDTALLFPVHRQEPLFLGMGIMSRDKGGLDLVTASIQALRGGTRLRVALAGPEREQGVAARIRAQLQENGLADAVELTGSVRGEAKLRLFQEAAVSVLPSYYENFPLVLIEAAAAGHAIITTPVGAVPEFFQDGVSALFVAPGDTEQLAQAMARLVRDPSLRNRLGEEARRIFVQRLARSEIMASLQRAYAAVLDKGT